MKDIIGFEKLYSVTFDGKVWAYPRVRRFKQYNHLVVKRYKGKWLSCKPRPDGYVIVNICRDGKYYWKYMHRLVAEAFIPNPHKFPEINHLDNNPTNNHFKNLEWCTTSHNIKYGYKTGRHIPIRGEKVWCAKLTPMKVRKIRILCAEGKQSFSEIATLYGVSKGTVAGIKQRRKWKYVV